MNGEVVFLSFSMTGENTTLRESIFTTDQAQMFSCEFNGTLKNTCFVEHLCRASSVYVKVGNSLRKFLKQWKRFIIEGWKG